MTTPISLRHSRRILQHAWALYNKKKETLSKDNLTYFEDQIVDLKEAVELKDRERASTLASKLESFCKEHFPRKWFSYLSEILLALIFALVVATLIRQVWFELYEIPTGSMRPTFKEQDRLAVTKTAFGINVPLQTDHFYFDPSLVQNTGVVIFTADNMDMRDTDTTYFGLFPAKKRLIKRMIGKPGDTLYFYGGKIYGIDAQGNEIKDLLDAPWMAPLEYVPYISFEGRTHLAAPNTVVFKQMNQPVGRVSLGQSGVRQGEIYNGHECIKDQFVKEGSSQAKVNTFSDLWGIGNFAMARLLTKEQVLKDSLGELPPNSNSALYLELRHHPSFNYPQPRVFNDGSGILLTPEVSIIPLEDKQLETLMQNMYTARFVVEKGRARNYSFETAHFMPTYPSLTNIPDGMYEFYYGKAYSVGFGGMTSLLPPTHPIYKYDPAYLQKLFNLGIRFDTSFAPYGKNQVNFPNRYAYFKEGDLYVLGAPLLKKEDPALKTFNETERKKEEASSANRPYVAFKDRGAPMKEGKLDKAFIETFGLKIPPQQYLVLGDNHAMSGDSRDFGFVPEANLQGAPSLIMWPIGDRTGFPPQKPYPIFVFPRLVIWSIAGLLFLAWYLFTRRHQKITLKKREVQLTSKI